jgi:hypothetical protein
MGRLTRRLTLATGTLAAALLVPAPPVGACSCAFLDPRDALSGSAAAVAGTVTERRLVSSSGAEGPFDDVYEYTLRVQRAYKRRLGPTVRLRSGSNPGTCGVLLDVGERVAFYLDGRREPYEVSLCQGTSAATLRRAASPFPRPAGRGRVGLLLAGAFTDARLMALDRRGRILAYGFGGGQTTAVSACPGGARAAELVTRGRRTVLALRRLSDLRVLRESRVPSANTISCRDTAGDDVVLFSASEEEGERSRLFRVSGGAVHTLATGVADEAVFTATTAFLSEPRRLLGVDLATGARRTVARPRFQLSGLAAGGDAGAVAGVQFPHPNEDGRRLAAVVDVSTGAVRTSRLSGDDDGAMVWLGPDRVAFAPEGESTVRVFDRRLRPVARFRGSLPGAVLLGGRLYGAGFGLLTAAQLPRGPTRTVRRLPVLGVSAVEAVPAGPTLRIAARRRPVPYLGAGRATAACPPRY